MKSRTEVRDDQDVIEEIKAKQRNTVWPDTMRNGRSVDAFLWKGDPDAPRVQRIGACIFGLFFILCGAAWLDAAYERRSPVVGVLSIAWFLVGGRIFLNGFRRRRARATKAK
jgi:hypothetical protein